MIHMKTGAETPRIPASKATATKPEAPGMKPAGTAGAPTPAQAAAMMTGPGRVAPNSSTTPAKIGTTPPKPFGKKDSGSTTSTRSAARREAHTGHASVAPAGRERGSGGGGGGGFGNGSQKQEHQDIHDWLPFSAQQSRIIRKPASHVPGLTTVAAHPFHPLKAVVFSMAGRFYTEVLPSLFRRTPQQVDQSNRDIRKDALRKEQKHHSVKNEARREGIRKKADSDPHRVMAGDLTAAFAGT